MADRIYLDEIDHYELIAFTPANGIAASVADKRMVFFNRIGGVWTTYAFDIADISRIEQVSVSPETMVASGGPGMHAAGQSLGVSARNAMSRSRANKGTGIRIHLRTLGAPPIFIVMPIDEQRATVFDGLSQFLNEAPISGKLLQMPLHIRDSLTRPTEAQIKRQQRRQAAFAMSLRGVVVLVICTAIATVATLFFMWTQSVWSEQILSNRSLRLEILATDAVLVLLAWAVVLYVSSSIVRYLRA